MQSDNSSIVRDSSKSWSISSIGRGRSAEAQLGRRTASPRIVSLQCQPGPQSGFRWVGAATPLLFLEPAAMVPLRSLSRAAGHVHRLISRPRLSSPSPVAHRVQLLQQHLRQSSSTSTSSNSNPLDSLTPLGSRTVSMDAKTKQQYLADSPPTVVRLEIKPHWDRLKSDRSRKYAHYLSRSASLFTMLLKTHY